MCPKCGGISDTAKVGFRNRESIASRKGEGTLMYHGEERVAENVTDSNAV